MSIGKALWMLSISAFYFSVISIFDFFENENIVFVATMLLGAVAIYLADKLEGHLKYLSLLLLPLPYIILYYTAGYRADGTSYTVLTIPLLLTTIGILTEGKFIVHWRLKKFAAFFWVLELFVLFVAIEFYMDMVTIGAYSVISIVAQILSLNYLRYGNGLDKRGRAYYNLSVVLGGGIVIGLTASICLIGRKTAGLAEYIFTIIASPFIALVNLLAGNVNPAVFLPSKTIEATEEMETTTEEIVEAFSTGKANGFDSSHVSIGVGVILTVIILLIVIYLIVRLVRKYLERLTECQLEEAGEFDGTVERISGINLKRNTKRYDRSNRDRVRRLYARYMRRVCTSDLLISVSSTSQDVCEEGKQAKGRKFEDDKIRELYIKARYSQEEITDDDVKLMKRLIKGT